jgi:Ca2+-binding EF-hand superfamily protein
VFSVLKKAFDAFDHEKKGCISTEMVGTILEMLGHRLDDDMLAEIIAEVDADGAYITQTLMSIVTSSDATAAVSTLG